MSEGPAKSDEMDFKWHLAADDPEIATTEMEFALMRTFESFGRWQAECLIAVSGLTLSGPENALLHIIRMNDRAKSVKELARLTNRDDIPNIQYSLRKMLSEGLITKQGTSRTGVTYEATDKGREVTDVYATVRRRLLVEKIDDIPDFVQRLQEVTRTLNILSGLYEEASRVAATHRR
ncbi:winged helix DNA-binding protein [Thalassovita aquimarina]